MAMKNRLGGHTNSYHTYSLEEALEGIAAAGFRYVELSAVRGWTEHVPLDADAKTLGHIQRMMNSLGLVSLSLSGHSDLTTKAGLEDGLLAVDLCERMGIAVMNTAIGGHASQDEDEEAFMGNIHALADYAAARDIKLGIEIHGEITKSGAASIPVLARIGRYDDAVRAWRNSITYNGESASRRADLGEAIAAASGGVVTAESKAEFDRAIALDPNEVKARYFTGLAAEQDGRKDDAINIWRGMLASAPADAPWRPLVQGALVRVGVVAPKLSDDTIAAAKDMTEGDRNTMIRGMVDRLATRLKDNGNDVEGWLRLVRAYMVLGERDKAQAALIDARGAIGNDAGRLQQLNDGLKSLGLDG